MSTSRSVHGQRFEAAPSARAHRRVARCLLRCRCVALRLRRVACRRVGEPVDSLEVGGEPLDRALERQLRALRAPAPLSPPRSGKRVLCKPKRVSSVARPALERDDRARRASARAEVLAHPRARERRERRARPRNVG